MAARAMWKGVIRFDTEQVPVKLYSANEYTGGIMANSKRPSLSEGHLWFCTPDAQGVWAPAASTGSRNSRRVGCRR